MHAQADQNTLHSAYLKKSVIIGHRWKDNICHLGGEKRDWKISSNDICPLNIKKLKTRKFASHII